MKTDTKSCRRKCVRSSRQEAFANAIGDWQATDPNDNSHQTLTIEKTTAEQYTILLIDEAASSCGKDSSGSAFGAEVTGSGGAIAPILNIKDAIMACLTDPNR